MATTPTIPTPTTTPTPAPVPTPEPTTAQLREAAVTASAPVAEPTPAPTVPEPTPVSQPYTIQETPEGVEIKLETGAVYKGKTWQDAAAELIKGKTEADKTIRQLRTSPAPTPDPTPTPAPVAQEDPSDVAAREWIVEQFAKSVGMDPQQFKAMMPQMFQVAQNTQSQNLAMAFMQRCPDFPQTPEASDALLGLAEQMGLPTTPDGLEAAHVLAVRRGLYKPLPQPTAAPTTPTPNPMLTTGAPPAVAGTPTEQDMRTMPLAQLRELAMRK